METILEQQRRYHEERERLVDAMVKEMLHKKNTYRELINSDHRLKYLLDKYLTSTERLVELYEDKDGQRKAEVASLTGPNEFQEFYSRLKQIKDFYRKHPNEISVPMSIEFDELAKARENPTEEMANLIEFSDEEGYGKYLDLHECYEKYINLKGIEKVDYITYLGMFDQLYDIPKERKTGEYRKYLLMLIEYLSWFVQRIKPLMDIDIILQVEADIVEQNWDSGNVPGWPISEMPENSTDYSHEVDNGKNLRSVTCKYCTSVILIPCTASFTSFEFNLPLMSQKKNDDNIETETVTSFWIVNDMFTFQNVGFSHTVGNKKYLTCADCEAGPIGYHDLSEKKSYVALSRVVHN